MRIWLAPSAFFPHRGGVEELTLKIGQHLRRRGHDVLVLTNRHPHDLPEADTVDGLAVRRVAFSAPSGNPRRWGGYLRSRQEVGDALAAVGPPPDVLHVICASVQVPPLLRATAGRGSAVVVTTQGETEMDADRVYQRSRWMRRQLVRASLQADALTACSAWTAEHTATVAPAFADARVVPNGIDPQDWAGLPARPDSPVLAAWGRQVHQKGFDLLLDAFALVRERRPRARLLLGGSGPEHARLAAAAGPGVELWGSLDRAGVARLLGQARVAVVPSRVEPFGIVALEALAAGRGLVFSTRGGLAEASGGLGRGADPFDREALAAAIEAEIDDPVQLEAATRHVAAHSWQVLTDEYERVYAQARANHG